jgi:aryl-alcohol dehydrogenase-like predicted oxidoreductase
MQYRPLADTGIEISEVALGCWPIAGLTSPGVNEQDSLATIAACFELGVNHLDTAYMYGREGESERLIARALGARRDQMMIATKGGLHWDKKSERFEHDARPATLRRECEESLQRLGTDRVELYYLHAADRNVPVAESAGELRRLIDEGKTRAVGASNLDVTQLDQFIAECPLAAFQPPYNMLKRDIERDTLPWCQERGVAVLVYWPLMKGLLGGKLRADQDFTGDSRAKYPLFQGDEYRKNLELVERMRTIAARGGHTVAQLAVRWILDRPGITSAICGAKRPDQIRDTAAASDWQLDQADRDALERALADRGIAASREAF